MRSMSIVTATAAAAAAVADCVENDASEPLYADFFVVVGANTMIR